MPTQTDRDKVKDFQEGQAVSIAGISNAQSAISDMHSRQYSTSRPYAANDTAAWTKTLASLQRKSRCKAFKIDSTATIANDSTDYVKFTLSWQYANGDAGKTLGSWNTHTSAQGAITANVTASVTVVTNSDAEVPAGAKLRLAQAIGGAGKNVTVSDTAFT